MNLTEQTKREFLQLVVYRGECEQILVSRAEEARLEKARLERERLEAVGLEKLRLERERLELQRKEERKIIAVLEAENRRIARLRRERRIAALRKIAICGVPGIVLGLLAFFEIKLQPDRSVESANENGISDSATKVEDQYLSDQEIDDMFERDLKAQGITPDRKETQQELEEEVRNLPAYQVELFTNFLQRPKAEQQQMLLQFNEHDRALMQEFKVRQFLRNLDQSNQ